MVGCVEEFQNALGYGCGPCYAPGVQLTNARRAVAVGNFSKVVPEVQPLLLDLPTLSKRSPTREGYGYDRVTSLFSVRVHETYQLVALSIHHDLHQP